MRMLADSELRYIAGADGGSNPTVTVPDITVPMAPIPMAQVTPSPCSLTSFGQAADSGLNTGATYGIDAADQAEQLGDDSHFSQAGIIGGNMAIQATISVAQQAYQCAKSKLGK